MCGGVASVTIALGRLKQKNEQFQASRSYTVRVYPKKHKNSFVMQVIFVDNSSLCIYFNESKFSELFSARISKN
jgi:sucrose-6-phosphate hydrolase SacC (GH32 family)